MTVVGVIQARLASTRWPRKILADCWGKPMLRRVMEAVCGASRLTGRIVAVPDVELDEIMRIAEPWQLPIAFFPGHPTNVLDRIQRAAKHADVIVRLTADCPMLSAGLIDYCVDWFIEGLHPPAPIASSHHDWDECGFAHWPEGFDVEVMLGAALQALTEPDEHVTSKLFPRLAIPYRGSINTPEDLG